LKAAKRKDQRGVKLDPMELKRVEAAIERLYG